MNLNIVTKEDLNSVAVALGALNEQMLYVGGSIIEFYAEDPASPKVRPTEDIDMATSVPSYLDWTKLESALFDLGISNDASRSLCSFTFRDIQLDIIPLEPMEVGPVNPWFERGLGSAIKIELEDALIKILSAPYFIATKFEAFNNRGGQMRLSSDIEDVIYLVNTRSSLGSEVIRSDPKVREFLIQQFNRILKDQHCEEIIAAHLEEEFRYEVVFSRISAIVSGANSGE